MNKIELKATDLMVGDWVQWKNKYVQIATISGIVYSFGHIDVELARCGSGIIERHDLKSISPIPLTPEILERNGFVLARNEPETADEPPYKEWRFTDGLITISFEPEVLAFEVHNGGEGSKPVRTMNYFTDYDVVFIHEFQHALRQCGLSKLADNFKLE